VFQDISAQVKKGNIHALVVGVSKYSNPSDNLTYPNKDAMEVYNVLKAHTTSDKIKLLTDQSATFDNIVKAANQLFTSTKSEDIVIFHFSGHGSKSGFAAYDKNIQYTVLKAIFKKTRANRKIIFADACFSGNIRTTKTGKKEKPINIGNQNVCLFLSSRSDQYSVESSGLKNGSFSYFLVAGLRGGADADRNKIITARELFVFVNSKVKEHTKGKQVPVMWGKFQDTMEILNWNK